jgi:hypothetical protein
MLARFGRYLLIGMVLVSIGACVGVNSSAPRPSDAGPSVVVTGAGSTETSPAIDPCAGPGMAEAKAHGSVTGIVGSFKSTAGEVAAWQETRGAPDDPHPASPWRTVPSDESVVVCYIDGTFSGFPGPSSRPPYDRLILLITSDNVVTLDTAGYRALIPALAPSE